MSPHACNYIQVRARRQPLCHALARGQLRCSEQPLGLNSDLGSRRGVPEALRSISACRLPCVRCAFACRGGPPAPVTIPACGRPPLVAMAGVTVVPAPVPDVAEPPEGVGIRAGSSNFVGGVASGRAADAAVEAALAESPSRFMRIGPNHSSSPRFLPRRWPSASVCADSIASRVGCPARLGGGNDTRPTTIVPTRKDIRARFIYPLPGKSSSISFPARRAKSVPPSGRYPGR